MNAGWEGICRAQPAKLDPLKIGMETIFQASLTFTEFNSALQEAKWVGFLEEFVDVKFRTIWIQRFQHGSSFGFCILLYPPKERRLLSPPPPPPPAPLCTLSPVHAAHPSSAHAQYTSHSHCAKQNLRKPHYDSANGILMWWGRRAAVLVRHHAANVPGECILLWHCNVASWGGDVD